MKTQLSLALAAGPAGVAFFTLSNTQFAASLPFDALLAAAATLGLIGLALADYSRRPNSLRTPAALLRPVARRGGRAAAGVERTAA